MPRIWIDNSYFCCIRIYFFNILQIPTIVFITRIIDTYMYTTTIIIKNYFDYRAIINNNW